MLLCQLWALFICSSTGPRRAHIPTALLATSCVPVNHKTSEQAILYKGQQHLLEMITLLLFHLLKFKIAIYNSSWKTRNCLSQSCVCVCVCTRQQEGSDVSDTQRGVFCVSPKTHHLCTSKKEMRNVDVREAGVSLAMQGNGTSEVSVTGDPPCSHLEVAMASRQHGR